MAAEELMRNAPENRGELAEDLDLGHEDNEPHMLKAIYIVLENMLWNYTK
jgi:hypothetical protein